MPGVTARTLQRLPFELDLVLRFLSDDAPNNPALMYLAIAVSNQRVETVDGAHPSDGGNLKQVHHILFLPLREKGRYVVVVAIASDRLQCVIVPTQGRCFKGCDWDRGEYSREGVQNLTDPFTLLVVRFLNKLESRFSVSAGGKKSDEMLVLYVRTKFQRR